MARKRLLTLVALLLLPLALAPLHTPVRAYTGEVSAAPAETHANLTGVDQEDRTPSGLWPSDHAGVVARLRFDQ
jgi:hypothetical protein